LNALAKIFLNDGFTTKAIAIYKKVAKLAPEESRPLERLAELYVQQGSDERGAPPVSCSSRKCR